MKKHIIECFISDFYKNIEVYRNIKWLIDKLNTKKVYVDILNMIASFDKAKYVYIIEEYRDDFIELCTRLQFKRKDINTFIKNKFVLYDTEHITKPSIDYIISENIASYLEPCPENLYEKIYTINLLWSDKIFISTFEKLVLNGFFLKKTKHNCYEDDVVCAQLFKYFKILGYKYGFYFCKYYCDCEMKCGNLYETTVHKVCI